MGAVADWPLIGRAAELDQVDELLRAGAGGVVLAGPAGVGKTRLAGECLKMATGRGFVPIRVAATQASAALPFGAFGPLLPDLAGGLEPTEVLRRVSRAILERGEGKPVALLVDDAHLLDQASAVLTHQLAAGQNSFVVATVRSDESPSDAVIALWKDGLAERVEVSPLSQLQVELLLAAALGDAADGATVHRLWARTNGNVLFLRELVMGALEGGVLRNDAGLWRLEGDLPASTRLVELVEARMTGLLDAERTLLEVVALGEPLGVDFIEPNGGPTACENLERRGLLRVEQDGRRLQCRLAHPLFGEVLRARLSPLHGRSLRRTIAERLEAVGARRREDVLRAATWRLDGGGDVDPGLLVAAAHQAHGRSDGPLAERLARAAQEAGAGFDAGLLLGKVLNQFGRPDEALAVLTAVEARKDNERADLAIALADSFYALGRDHDAIMTLERAEAAIGDPRARDEVTAERIVLLFATGRVLDARTLAETLTGVAQGQALVRASNWVGILLARAGRATDALAAAERGRAITVDLPWGQQEKAWTHATALLYAGRLREAEVRALEEYNRAVAEGWRFGQGAFAWALMNVYLAQGRAQSAIRWGQMAAGLYRQQGHRAWLGWTLPFLAHALALNGRPDEAEAALAEHEVQALRIERLRAQAWVAVARDDLGTAHARLREAIELACHRGESAVECSVLHDRLRLGRAADASARLMELAGVVEGPLAAAQALHARSYRRDPAGLEAASAAFEELGALLLAAEAAADAAVAWRKAGDPRRASAAERRAHALADRCEGARTPALAAVSARAALTTRELEIARLAAAGVPNKEIAERLFLSLHTVQNKLHAAYEKLGIQGRAELADALDGT